MELWLFRHYNTDVASEEILLDTAGFNQPKSLRDPFFYHDIQFLNIYRKVVPLNSPINQFNNSSAHQLGEELLNWFLIYLVCKWTIKTVIF